MDLPELGAFLRSRRDRIRPSDVGLAAGQRRRVPGLRRDEVALLADASVDYYNELEQARGAQPTEQMLASLARALRLTSDESDHLYFLAGRQIPPRHGPAANVHPGMLDLLERLPQTPAMVITDLHVPMVQNRLAVALLGQSDPRGGIAASYIHSWFTEPASRSRYHPEEHHHQSQVFVADLQAVSARRDEDPEVRELISHLQDVSEEFAALWERRDVKVRRADRKRLVHPQLGVMQVDCLSLLSEDGSQRLLWFTPPAGGAARDQFAALASAAGAPADPGGTHSHLLIS